MWPSITLKMHAAGTISAMLGQWAGGKEYSVLRSSRPPQLDRFPRDTEPHMSHQEVDAEMLRC